MNIKNQNDNHNAKCLKLQGDTPFWSEPFGHPKPFLSIDMIDSVEKELKYNKQSFDAYIMSGSMFPFLYQYFIYRKNSITDQELYRNTIS